MSIFNDDPYSQRAYLNQLQMHQERYLREMQSQLAGHQGPPIGIRPVPESPKTSATNPLLLLIED